MKIELFNVWVNFASGWERYRNEVPSLTLANTVAGNARRLTGCETKIIEPEREEEWLKSVRLATAQRSPLIPMAIALEKEAALKGEVAS